MSEKKNKQNINQEGRKFFILSLVVVSFLLLFGGVVGMASATDYYVATWGSDSDEGTSLDHPWQHPSYAAEQAQAGDTIYLLDGTWYDEHVVFANSGDAANPITMTAYNGTPTLDGVDKTGLGISIWSDQSFIDITGSLVIKNYNDGIHIGSGASHINIRDLTITSLGGWGVKWRPRCSDITVDKTTITHTSGGAVISWLAGHAEYEIHNITITNNVFDDNNHDAINIFSNNKDVLIENNLITDASHGAGIMVHDFGNENIIIRNNRMEKCTRGIWLIGVAGCLVEDNTILDSHSSYGILLYTHENSGSVVQNAIIRNCVIKNSDGYGVFVYSNAGVPIENVLFEGNSIEDIVRFYGSSISDIRIRDMRDATRSLAVSNTVSSLEIEFTDGRKFSVNGEGAYSSNSITSTGTYEIAVIDVSTGTISGTVTDGTNPIQEATISDGTRSATTDETGCYTISNVPSGTYTVTCIKEGYLPASQDDVVASEGTANTADFTLTPLPSDTTAPAAVADLAASNPTTHSIELTWIAPGDDGNTGTASQYEIRYTTTEISEGNWISATQCIGEPTPQIAGSDETYTITGLSPDTTYYIALKTADEAPNWSDISNSVSGTTTEAVVELASYWVFDEGSGNTAQDSSGNNNDGTIHGASWTEGKLGKALSFDGTNDYVACGQDTSLKITGAITVEAWVNWQGDGNPYIVTKTGGPSHRSCDLSGNADGTVEFRVGGADCNTVKSSGTAPIPTGEWVYLVGIYEPSSYVRLFVNGALAEEETTSIPAAQGDNGLPWYIGAREGNQGYFDGIIDEVKIHNGALSAEEIRANYDANSTNNPPAAIIDSITPETAEQGKDNVSFSGHGTDTDGSVVAYNWRSNIDGLLSTASSFSKSASELSVSTHTIYFKVQDDNGEWSTEVTEDLTIIEQENFPPIANLKGPYTGTEGAEVVYDGSNSYDPDGSIVAYVWDFGDGDTGTGATPTHTYAQDGTYTVALTVTDNGGATNTSTTTATIADTEPTADFSASPTSGQEPLTVTFTDNSASHDGIVTWNWDFDNDGETDSTEQNQTHEYIVEGIYTVSLTVRESDGDSKTMTKADYIAVTKENNAPFTPANPSPSDGATDVLIEAILSWTGGDQDAEDTVTYNVYFGTSMTPPLVAEKQPRTTYDPSTLEYSTEYYWQIEAKDNHGATAESEVWCFSTSASPGSDLVGEWNFDEGTGITAVDTSGNGNDGTLVNNPTWTNGKAGKALRFDGTDDYVDCGQDTSLKITGAITVEAWVNWQGDGNPYIVTKTGRLSHRSYDLSGNADGTVEFRVGGADCNTVKSSGTAPIPTGEWVYLVGTYEPSSYVRLFVNGALAEEETTSIPAAQGDNGLPWYIGAREGNQGYFDGIIDEVKIHNGALSAEEIMANYEAYPTNQPPTAIIESITPETAEQGKETVSFTGHGTDTDGTVVAYNWRSDLDGQLSTVSSFGKSASELSVGTHTIYFKVQDDNGAWSTEVTDELTITSEPENRPPVADLKGPYTGTEGIAIAYDGSNSYDPDGSIVAYEWDFGDGNTATGVTPTHTYAHEGTYTVTLTVTDNDGATNTSTTTATIADSEPTTAFSASPTSGYEPLTVAFSDNSASYDGIEAWEWDFDNDDVTDSTAQNPTHEYTEGGVYTVSLIVTESDGDSDTLTKTDYITVTNVNNAPYAPDNPSPSDGATEVAIDEAFSWTGGDPDAEDTVTYDIYFGTSITPPLVAEHQSENTYDPGMLDHSTEYYWQIVAKDNHGALTESEVWSSVTDSALEPDLVAEWDLDEGSGTTALDSSGNGNDGTLINNPTWVNGKVGKGLSFDGTDDYVNCGQKSSLKITGAITVEAWVNWQGDGNPYIVTKTGRSGKRSYDLSGNADGTVEFRVGGADCNTVKSSGTAPIPTGEWVYLVGIYEPSSYVRLFVNGALAEEETTSIPAAQGDNGLPWYIGAREGNQGYFDGIIDEVKIHNGALSAEEIMANYEANPTNIPPFADPKGPYTGTEGVSITFDGSTSSDPDGSIDSYLWDFGDGNTSSEVTPTHTYAQDGTYTVTLKVTDNDGAINTSTTMATIVDTEPTADFSAMPTSGDGPLTVGFSDNSASYDGIEEWAWDFDNDDVTDSTAQNPTYMYAEDGIYTVSLTVTESDGNCDIMTKANYISVTGVNNAPYAPDNPSPSEGATEVSIDETLSWTGGDPDDDDTVTYDVYFGNSMSPPLVAENQPENTYDPGTRGHRTEYYWQIVAKDNHGATTEGEVWSFVTAASPDSDLVAEWHFDAGSGQTAVDSSRNGNDGTLVNNPAWVNGKVGKALSFDDTNDYVDCGQDTSLKITGAITVEAWVNWQGDGNPYIVTKTGGPRHRSYDLSGNSDGTVEFRLGGADCNSCKSSGTTPIPTGEWVYLVGTYEPSSYVRLFVNGALAKECITSIPASQGDNGLAWYIGAREGNQGWFDGIIDEVKIHNGALSAEEIRANYEANPTNQPPIAAIDSITPETAEQGKDAVSFTGHGTDTDGLVVAYNWRSSVEGQLSTASSFSKSASELSTGTHTIYFKLQDDNGAWSTEVTDELTITSEPENRPPVADLKGPYTGTEGIAIAYDGSNSYDPDGSIVAYEWDFGDGNTATGVAPTHTYAHNGTYTVALTVTDNDGATNTSTTTATIADTEPTADFSTAPTSGLESLTVTFTDNSESSDGIVTWDWDFDNDGETDSTEQNPTQVYAEDGIYTVSLTITESDEDSDTMTKEGYITVTKVNEPPEADPSGPYTGTEGAEIVYDGSNSYDPEGSIVAYEWDFGDGNTATGVAPTHTYAQEGTYTVALTVTDNYDKTGTCATTATIADTEPTADFSAARTHGPEPLTVAFTDNSVSCDGIETWSWDFDNDGVADSTEQNPAYVYIEYGRYTVSLTVTESDGDSGTMTKADHITAIIGKESHRHTPAGVSPSGGATDVPVDED